MESVKPENGFETRARAKMLANILTSFVGKLNRDNKNHYCKDHAMERAELIEDMLYRNCKGSPNWLELYNDINADDLVTKILPILEKHTPKCNISIMHTTI